LGFLTYHQIFPLDGIILRPWRCFDTVFGCCLEITIRISAMTEESRINVQYQEIGMKIILRLQEGQVRHIISPIFDKVGPLRYNTFGQTEL